MKLNTRTIVAIGIGAAVFVILNKFVSIPTGIPDTSISTAYPFLAFMAVIFGPVAAAFIGFIGHLLTDVWSGWGIWWSWVVVSPFVGAVIGLCWKKIDIESGDFGWKKILLFNLYSLVANAIGWCLIAPCLDILIYAEPKDKVFTQGAVAGAANFVSIAVLGTLFLAIYAKTRVKAGSLKSE